MRIALGCMRVAGVEPIRAAIDAGVTTFDTARAYGGSEAMLARAIVESGVDRARLRVVTKAGMHRVEGAPGLAGWRADGRARTIEAQTRASVEALSPVGIDVLMLHAVDPRTSMATSVRALARAKDQGVVGALGVSNVTRAQLEEAASIAPLAAVEVALGAFDEAAARGGLVQACAERGLALLAHSPLGGPKRAPKLARDPVLMEIARAIEPAPTPIELFLAYLLQVHPCIVPLVGAARVETVTSALRAETLTLDEPTLRALDDRFPALGAVRRPRPRAATTDREVVMIMGIAGAGKSRLAAEWTARGHVRLNRDDRGGSLRAIAEAIDRHLEAGDARVVVDNTYLTRASRNEVIAVAHRRGARVRCVHLDTPLNEAQINVALRLVREGKPLDARDEVRATTLHRLVRALEPPTTSEGFDAVETIPFQRFTLEGDRPPALAIALESASDSETIDATLASLPGGARCLVFAWHPDPDEAWQVHARSVADDLAQRTGRAVDLAVCPHPAGPPTCWCRPPLPGLWIAFAERQGVRTEGSAIVGASSAHATMARALGVHFVAARSPGAGGGGSPTNRVVG
jgi:aryl-alcohol dehydrogenase-like predicted oxidoreductase